MNFRAAIQKNDDEDFCTCPPVGVRSICAGFCALELAKTRHGAGLAQLVEHLICNQGVAGSTPAAGTINIKALAVNG